jgi:hypothetical protein
MSFSGLPAGAGDALPQTVQPEGVMDTCASCGLAVGQWYFRVDNTMSCLNCAQAAKNASSRDSGRTYARALLFGAGGAIAGLIVYAAFGILTGLVAGYLSLGVGYVVAKAMMMGSRGVGGRRYQWAAVLLTYAAVSMAAIPIEVGRGIRQYRAQTQARRATSEVQVGAGQRVTSSTDADQRLRQEFGDTAAQPYPSRTGSSSAGAQNRGQVRAPSGGEHGVQARSSGSIRPVENVAAALVYLTVMGLASPFLELQREPISGVIGLIILMVGIRIAWQLTAAKKAEIIGPFQSTKAA